MVGGVLCQSAQQDAEVGGGVFCFASGGYLTQDDMIFGKLARGVDGPGDGGVGAVDIGKGEVVHVRAGGGVGEVDDHLAGDFFRKYGEGEGTVGLLPINLRAVHVDAGHAPVVVGIDGERHILGGATRCRGCFG